MSNPLKSYSEEHNVHPVYRPDIDGLRAMAILSVVIFHAFPSGLPGGFVGVDVFFVISGFLISNIVFRSLQRGDFSFAEFYAHRVKRIFPALIVVLTTCYALGWFVLLPDEFKQLGKHMAAGAGFVQNFVLRKEVGYFDVAAELKPLLHLWSLAIEEQFYLVYPVLVFVAWRLRLNVLTVIVLLCLLSFGLNVTATVKRPAVAFFMPQTRFWELLAGSMLAYLQFFKRTEMSAWMQHWAFHPALFHYPPLSVQRATVLNNLLSVLGISLLVAAVFFINKSKHFPGWWVLLPVLGAFLLILAGPEALVNRTILANRLMVFVGIISYPLYLWHWPILSFARILESEAPSPEIRAAAITLSAVLSWLTYRLIERPIRFGKKTWVKTALLCGTLAIVGYIGYNTFQRNGLEFRVKPFVKFSKAAGEWDYPGKLLPGKLDGIDYFYLPSGRKSVTLFVGDSNIEQYFPRVEALIASDKNNVNGIIFKTAGGCLAIPDVPLAADWKHCALLAHDALRIAREKPEVKRVVIGQFWLGHLRDGFGIPEGNYGGIGSPEYFASLDRLGKYIKELRALNKEVYLVLSIPGARELDPKYLVKRDLKMFPKIFSVRTNGVKGDDIEKDYGRLHTDLAEVAVTAGAIVINPMSALCFPDCLGVDAEGEPMYKDLGHLRPFYVRRWANFIDVTVR